MSDLKPCPFCGSKAELIMIEQALPYSIACTSTIDKECYLYSGYEERIENDARAWDDVLFWYAEKSEAVKAWNTRKEVK